MSPYELNGPWTGVALRDNPPIPYALQRRRRRFKIALVVITTMVMIGCGLFGLSHWEFPQI